ncbi:MAG: ribbon-helix-helix domain-containing protein [Spirochaetes bacterium]|nr:ribbon-helix-helix domain-containing protein [Spirochaetota bacterium]
MKKQEVVTFKVDESLMELIKDIPNRSEFIRHAILQAMDNVCPLCQGSGILSPHQKKHWDSFLQTHSVRRCDECNEIYIDCPSAPDSVGAVDGDPSASGAEHQPSSGHVANQEQKL